MARDWVRKAGEVENLDGEVGKIKETVDKGVPSAIQRIMKSAGSQRKPEEKDRERRDHPAAPGLIPGQAPARHNGSDASKGQGSGGTRIFKADGPNGGPGTEYKKSGR